MIQKDEKKKEKKSNNMEQYDLILIKLWTKNAYSQNKIAYKNSNFWK